MLKCLRFPLIFKTYQKKLQCHLFKVALHDQLRQRNDRNLNLRGEGKLFPYEYNS